MSQPSHVSHASQQRQTATHLTYASSNPSEYPQSAQFLVQRIADQCAEKGIPLGPLYQTLLIPPDLASHWYPLMQALRTQTSVPSALRELAMARVGALNGAAFEWMQHYPLMRANGLSEEGAETVRVAERGGAMEEGRGLAKGQWAVMRYCDQVMDSTVEDGLFAEVLQDACGGDEKMCLELTMTITTYNSVARFLNALDVAEMQHVAVGRV